MSEMKTKPKLFGTLVCTRSSQWGELSNVDEAREIDYIHVDRWAWINYEDWRETGENHREENGVHIRERKEKRWVVDIPDGAALEAFCHKYGQVILSENTDGIEPCFEIEIYDDYRE